MMRLVLVKSNSAGSESKLPLTDRRCKTYKYFIGGVETMTCAVILTNFDAGFGFASMCNLGIKFVVMDVSKDCPNQFDLTKYFETAQLPSG